MKRILLLLCISTWCTATVIVEGNDTSAPRGFLTPVTAKVFDRRTGTFFVGLAAGSSPSAFTISKAERPTFTTTPRFTAVLASTSGLLSATIEFLAFSNQTATLPVLAVVPLGGAAFSTATVFGLYTNGTHETQATDGSSTNLNDALGVQTSGIMNIAANTFHIFAPVRPSGNLPFGDPGSGVALIGIEVGATLLNLNIKNATTGLNGNLAAPLNANSTVLRGNSGGANVVFTTPGVPLFWDDIFNRLYIGVSIRTGGAAPTDIAKSIVAGRLAGNALVFDPIVADSAITTGATDEIVVAAGVETDLFVRHIRTMHTTTGPDYLIVNGGNGTVDTASNQVHALPLVFLPENPMIHGTLADKNSALNSNFKFTVPATTSGDLATTNESPALVGAGMLPIAPNTPVADMVVINDTVYVSVAQAPSPTNDAGVFYSQAIFDNDGKIARWTPWERATPFNAFPGITLSSGSIHDGPVSFFDVDASNGSVWITEGETNRVVGITQWGTGVEPQGLIAQLQGSLACGSYSVLDLDQATRGFLTQTIQRYALFGGANKVVITRISEAYEINNPSSPQLVITDFTLPENFLQTFLPKESGCVQALEYSRTSTADGEQLNYFFAGTETGFFAFADSNQNGFNSNTLSTLNLSPFSSGSWQKIDTITGSITDIKTSGAGSHTLYILAQAPTALSPLGSTIYAVPMTSNLSTMFAPANIRIIAQTGQGVFSSVSQIYGMQIIATNIPDANPEDKEQLIIATNQGLFRSFANQVGSNGISDALNQTAANWQVIPGTSTTPFLGISGMDTPVRQTVWPFSLEDERKCLTFERSSIFQTSGNGNETGTAPEFTLSFVPAHFNASPLSESFITLDPIINFFSDGARRFFIFNSFTTSTTQNEIGVIPYTINEWGLGQPTIITVGALEKPNRYFWIRTIGMSGYLMIGTGTGVVALE